MAETNANLNIVVKVRDEASAALNRMSNDVGDMGNSLNFAGAAAGVLAGAMSAIASSAIINSIKAFGDSEAKMASFNAILKTLPPNLQNMKQKILDVADNALLKFGFDNEDAALSIVKLMQATGDADFSFQAFQAAMDLARFKGISLGDATQALIISFQGGGRMLKQFGIEVDEHASKETILAAVMRKTDGQAQAYSETLNGQIDILRLLGGEAQEALGSIFAPTIKEVAKSIVGWIEAQGGLQAVLDRFFPLIQAIGVVLFTIVAAGFLVAGVAALALLGPLGSVIAAFFAISSAALLAFVLLTNMWPEIKKVALDSWNAVLGGLTAIWNKIDELFKTGIASIKAALQSIVDFFNNMVSTITGGIGNAVKSIGNAVKGVVPKFAEGGIVTRPTMGLIGEAGPEAVIPLNRLGGMSGGGITINLQGDFYTDEETADKFAKQIAFVLKNQLNLGGVRA